MPHTAVILAGHGSHISPDTAGLVWEAADALREMGVFDEVGAAFWKEQPTLATVLDSITAPDVTVVPLFTAQGYFTRTVIPAEMGIDVTLSATQHGERRIRYTQTLGDHPRIGDIVRRRIDSALAQAAVPLSDIAIALIGHATRRNPDSRHATEAQAALVRETVPVREVVAVYLDDAPSIPDVYGMTSAPVLVAVPYFLATGSHTTIDVPEALGLGAGATTGRVNGRRVLYTAPIGQRDDIVTMTLDLARDAGAPVAATRPCDVWHGFPQAGLSEAQRLLAAAPVQFGQLWITRDAVCHRDDAACESVMPLATPAALRRAVREQPFRPLATAAELPSGWRVALNGDVVRLHAVIETVYPGVLGTDAHVRAVGVAPDAWTATIARQTGQYRPLAALTSAQKSAITTQVCGGCVLHPVWADGASRATLVCREPCNWWLSAAVAAKEDE